VSGAELSRCPQEMCVFGKTSKWRWHFLHFLPPFCRNFAQVGRDEVDEEDAEEDTEEDTEDEAVDRKALEAVAFGL